MSAPAMAACAAKVKMAPRRMMKYDSTPPPELLLINPCIKKGTTPLNPHFASGCNCRGEHLARSRNRKGTRDLKKVTVSCVARKRQTHSYSDSLYSIMVILIWHLLQQ